jgi:competence protein ComEA
MLKKILANMALMNAAASFSAVDVTKATAAELDSVKGIGPGISTKILDERKKGSFKDWQDFIDRVKGVGEGNAAKFSAEGLTVNGSAFKGATAAKKDEKAVAKTDKKEDKAAAKEEKKDAKAEAKAEKKAKKDADKKAKEDAKMAKAEAAKPVASATKTAASAAKPASAKK